MNGMQRPVVAFPEAAMCVNPPAALHVQMYTMCGTYPWRSATVGSLRKAPRLEPIVPCRASLCSVAIRAMTTMSADALCMIMKPFGIECCVIDSR